MSVTAKSRRIESPSAKAKPALTVSRPQLLVDGSDEEFRHFVHDMLAFAQRIQDIRARFGHAIGLTGTQYTMLVAIAKEEGQGIGINQIAESIHFSASFVTIEINRLVVLKLVTKKAHPSDGRRVQLSMTAKGHDLLKQLKALQQPVNDALFSSLTHNDFLFLRKTAADLVSTADSALRLMDYLSSERSA